MGEDDLGGFAPQPTPQTQILYRTQEREGSDQLGLERRFSELAVGGKTEYILITHIRATDVAISLKRIPIGFYVALKSENVTKRTSNKPVSVGKDVVEWDDEIILRSDRSSRVTLTVFTSFELGPTLGVGEVLREFEITVGELLNCNGRLELVRFLEQSDEEVTSSPSSFEIEIELRDYDRNEYVAASNPPESEKMLQLGELTDRGHHALIRYRELQEQRDLVESIRHFEHVRDLCLLDHPSRATVLFNLATAKLIDCRVNDAFTDLDVPIGLYRAVLRLRPPGHPDHPFTLLSLGIALQARFQRQHNEADEAEAKTFLSQILDVAMPDSYVYHATVLALGSSAKPELTQPTKIPHTIESNHNDDEVAQRLDAALKWMFHPDSSMRVLLDHLRILFYVWFDSLGDPTEPEKAIPMLEAVVQLAPDNHPGKPLCQSNLGHLLSTRYKCFGDVVDLEKSVSMLENTVRITLDDDPDKALWLNNLGDSLSIHYERFGDVAILEKSISIFEDAVKITPDGHPDKALYLSNFGNTLLTRYKQSEDVADLERLMPILEHAVQLTPDGHPGKPVRLNNLGQSLLARYDRFGDVSDLERSISIREDAIQFTPDGHANKAFFLNNLGCSLATRYKRFGDVNDLEKSISILEDAMQFTPDGHPERALRLGNLGDSLSTRYKRFGDVNDLEESISILEDAVQFTADSCPDKTLWLNNLGDSLSARYKRFGDVADLKRSISIAEEVMQFTPDNHPAKPVYLDNLAHLLLTRFERFGGVDYLEKSISMFKDVVQFTPDSHPSKALRMNNLGNSLSTRYKQFGDVSDLEESISMFKDAVQLTPDGHPDKALHLGNLGNSLSTRYQRFGDPADLEKSISIFDDVVQFTSDDHPRKPLHLSNLGHSLSTRYERFGDVVDLERSISMREDAVQLTPDGHPDKPSWLSDLAYMLSARYKRFGDIADLERAISMREDAVQFTPDGHPDKALYLNNLGDMLTTHYERFGDVVDLEKSISMLEDAVQFTPDGHPNKALRLNNLGHSLSTRYEQFGDVADLERSISVRGDAVEFTPNDHPRKPLHLNNLGHSLSIRYERFGDIKDLEKSISMRKDAVQLTPDGHPDKAVRLNNLADSLLTRYKRSGDVGDLEKSISMFEDAMQFTYDGHPDKILWLNNLGYVLWVRYEDFGDVADLERSISMFEDVVQSTPDGHPDRPLRLNSLTLSLLERFRCSGDSPSSDLPRAISYSSHAACSHIGPSPDRFRASQLWIQCIRLLRHDSQSLLDAYTVAVGLLPQLAWIGLSLHDRHHQLLRAADEVCDAAAAALEAHRSELAVEWLEQGHSVVWGQLSQLRTPIDDLRTVHPELAAQLERVSHELEHAGAQDRAAVKEMTNHSNVMGESLEKQARQYHALALSRERLLAEIRALPGFERFLLPKTIDQLAPLAQSGPVIFLNASKHRCDALVVMTGSKRVVHVPLSNTCYDEVAGMQLRLGKLLRLNGRVILRDDMDRGARPEGMSPNEVFGSVLPYLWNKVVSPILEALAFSTLSAKLTRIFWCPAGPFAFLPIHAAGLYDRANPGPKLSDFVISSYIPTMSALELSPQENLDATSHHIRLLAVAQPSTDGQVQLTGVQKEMEVIRELTSSSPSVSFQEADGTVEDVLTKMTETDWIHFACHGAQDHTSPLDSGFLLAHRKRLRLFDIVRLLRPRGGLAFLSACQTAMGDEQLSEEAIHLAAGMLLAGYKGVIATMWSIADGDAPRVAEDVYKTLFRDGKAPDSGHGAEALHHAIERLRDSGAPFLSWVPFIHVGL